MPPRAFLHDNGEDEAVYVLRRVTDPKKVGSYTLEQRFIYQDPVREHWRFTVPKEIGEFETDLASVPGPATWLVPKDGTHTPAALLHDALVDEPGSPPCYIGPVVTREEADLIFREAMQVLEVPFLRRWMMWTAVSLATLMSPGGRRRHWYWRIFIPLITGALLVAGLVSILDLVDIHRVRVPWTGWSVSTALPWMGDRPAAAEIGRGAAAALAAAFATPVLWGPRWRIGLVSALAMIPFAFPLVVATAAWLAYSALEVAAYWVLRFWTRNRDTADEPVVRPKIMKRLA